MSYRAKLKEFFNLREGPPAPQRNPRLPARAWGPGAKTITDDDIRRTAQRFFTGDAVEDEHIYSILYGASLDASQGKPLGLGWSAKDYGRLKKYAEENGLVGGYSFSTYGEKPPGGW
jgi:hypothetical protein